MGNVVTGAFNPANDRYDISCCSKTNQICKHQIYTVYIVVEYSLLPFKFHLKTQDTCLQTVSVGQEPSIKARAVSSH